MTGADYLIEALLDGCAFTIAIEEASRLEVLAQKYPRLGVPGVEMLAAIDPTSSIDPATGQIKKIGGYTDWIIRQYLSKKTAAEKDRFAKEDAERLKDDLTLYTRGKAKIKPEYRDINKIKDDAELAGIVNALRTQIDKEDKKDGQAKKLYDDGRFVIVIPLDTAAACKYGAGTRWCTASTGSYNYFDSYNKAGPLCIIIDREANEKWQIAPDSHQYMDEEDRPVSLRSFRKILPEPARKAIADFYASSDGSGGNSTMEFVNNALMPGTMLDELAKYGTISPEMDFRDLAEFASEGKIDEETFNEEAKRLHLHVKLLDGNVWVGGDADDLIYVYDGSKHEEKWLKGVLSGDSDFMSDAGLDARSVDSWVDAKTTKLAKEVYRLLGSPDDSRDDDDEDWEPDDDAWKNNYDILSELSSAYSDAHTQAENDGWQKLVIGTAVEALSDNDDFSWQGEVPGCEISFILCTPKKGLPAYLANDDEESWAVKSQHEIIYTLSKAFIRHNGGEGVRIPDSPRYGFDIDEESFNDFARYRLEELKDRLEAEAEEAANPEIAKKKPTVGAVFVSDVDGGTYKWNGHNWDRIKDAPEGWKKPDPETTLPDPNSEEHAPAVN